MQSCRHNLPGVEPGPVPGVHLSEAKALAGSFAMSRFAGDFAPIKTPGKCPFVKALSILPGLLPLANCNISCSGCSMIKLSSRTVHTPVSSKSTKKKMCEVVECEVVEEEVENEEKVYNKFMKEFLPKKRKLPRESFALTKSCKAIFHDYLQRQMTLEV